MSAILAALVVPNLSLKSGLGDVFGESGVSYKASSLGYKGRAFSEFDVSHQEVTASSVSKCNEIPPGDVGCGVVPESRVSIF